MIKELTAKLLDKFLEEIKNEKNMTKIHEKKVVIIIPSSGFPK